MSGMQFEEGLPGNHIALTVDGVIDDESMHAFVERLEAVSERGEKAKVYIEFKTYSVELSAVAEKFKGMASIWAGIDRLAYVIDSAALRALLQLVDYVTPMHIRAFDSAHAIDARTWAFANE